MIIDKKSLQNLQILKIKHDFDEFPIPSSYLFICDKQCIFINKSKTKYQVCSSYATNIPSIYYQAVFNVIYESEDLKNCIVRFKNFIKDLL